MVREALTKHYLIQLNSMPAYADWQTPETRYKLYQFANHVPTWSPKWFWDAGRRFDDSYGAFVDALDVLVVTGSAQDAQLKTLATAWSKAQAALNTEQDSLDTQWDAYHKKYPTRQKKTWLQSHDAKLSTLKAAELQAFTKWNKELPSTGRTIAQMVRDYDSHFTSRIEIRLPDSAVSSVSDTSDPSQWETVQTMSFIGNDGDLNQLKTEGANAEKTNQFSDNWAVTKNDTQRYEEQNGFGGNISFGGFINIYGGGHAGQHSLQHSEQGFSLTFQARAMSLIPIGPSQGWYHEFLIDNYACGPFKKDISFDANDLWKTGGSLSLVASGVLVAYKPFVSVTMSDADYKEFEQDIGGSAGFSIGPFSFGGGGSSVKKTVETHSQSRTVTVNVTSETPMVLAVLSKRLNPDKVCH